jgi:hypothetical protein
MPRRWLLLHSLFLFSLLQMHRLAYQVVDRHTQRIAPGRRPWLFLSHRRDAAPPASAWLSVPLVVLRQRRESARRITARAAAHRTA